MTAKANEKEEDIPPVDVSSLIIANATADHSRAVCNIEVRPHEQLKASLGDFFEAEPLLGFTFQVTPSPPEDAMVTRLARLRIDDARYELVLQLANYSAMALDVEVRQLV